MASTDAMPVPKKNTAYRHYLAIRKNDGSLITTWAGQDSEVSKDGGNYSDCTNEATEIQTSGTGYIDLTASEMNADCVVLKITVTNTDAQPYVVMLFPVENGDIPVDATSVSGDVTAADNLEAAHDGTGYAGGTVKQQVDVVSVDGGALLDGLPNVRVTEFSLEALALLFTLDTGEIAGDAVAGSVVYEIINNVIGISVEDILGAEIDGGITLQKIMKVGLAAIGGNKLDVDDGGVQREFTLYARDGTTPVVVFSADKVTGARTGTSVIS